MLGRVFGNHSQILTFAELHFFEQQISANMINRDSQWSKEKLVSMLERIITSSRDGFFCPTIKGMYQDYAEDILASSKNNNPVLAYEAFLYKESAYYGKQIPCEQTPRYLFCAKEILKVFPDSLIINIIRDPRDVLLSQKNKWRRRLFGAKNIPFHEAIRAWINYHPYTITRLWVSAIRVARHLDKESRFISVRFEALLQAPEKEVKELCRFVGIEFEANMLEVPQIGSSMGMDQPQKKGIDKSRIKGWRNGGLTKVELAICQNIASKDMIQLGYDAESIQIPAWKKWSSMFIFGLKISIALLLNIKRSKNLFQSIRRRLIADS